MFLPTTVARCSAKKRYYFLASLCARRKVGSAQNTLPRMAQIAFLNFLNPSKHDHRGSFCCLAANVQFLWDCGGLRGPGRRYAVRLQTKRTKCLHSTLKKTFFRPSKIGFLIATYFIGGMPLISHVLDIESL